MKRRTIFQTLSAGLCLALLGLLYLAAYVVSFDALNRPRTGGMYIPPTRGKKH